ncbi:MAG TPA: LysR family transcriptional regulator, partial [Novosphingobium sp.]|nr:LysR family transcriptional regulator [Novosphingobium sp.]
MKRTHLPLNALRVFDAAARHLSFTRAADELAVTPAAVGQQIRALEDLMGVVLFRRTTKGLELTDEASSGLAALRAGFLQFEDAVQAMQAGQSSHVYTIAAPRDIFAAWLAPRLAAFRAANPEARLVIVDGDSTDFTEANLDLALRLTEGPGELEGAALGEALRVCVGEGDWIAWPGDPQPAGEDEDVLLTVGDAGQAMAAA